MSEVIRCQTGYSVTVCSKYYPIVILDTLHHEPFSEEEENKASTDFCQGCHCPG